MRGSLSFGYGCGRRSVAVTILAFQSSFGWLKTRGCSTVFRQVYTLDRPPCNPARRLLTLPAVPARLRAMSVRHRRRRVRALAGEVVGRAKADQRLMRQAEDQKRVEALQTRRVWAGGT